ncbi:hypothetical protein GCM10027299_49630 [Larkinella ripae]
MPDTFEQARTAHRLNPNSLMEVVLGCIEADLAINAGTALKPVQT